MSITPDNLKLAQLIPNALIEENTSGIALDVAGAVQSTVEKRRKDNKVDMEKNWEFYQGNHSQYFKQRRDEDDQLFKFRKQNIVEPNYCKYTVNLSAKFAYGRNGKVRRQFTNGDASFKKTDDRLRAIDKLVGYQAFMLKAKRNAGLFGEQPLRIIPVDERTGEIVEKADRWTYPHPTALDPRFTYCLTTEWGKIQAVVIEDEFVDYVDKNRTHKTLELIVPDSRWYWIDSVLNRVSKNDNPISSEFVCMWNDDTHKDELQDILDLQIKLDEAWTDQAHFYEKHGWPQLTTSINAQDVAKAPGYIWEITSDEGGEALKDKFHFLTWDGKENAARQYAKDLESMIFKITSTAPIATGDLENIGQIRSGAGLVTSYGPSIQKAQMQQVVWERNETNFFMAITMFDSVIHDEALDNRFPGLDIDIRFPDDFVPGEELVRAEINAMAANSHTITLRDIIRQKHPEFTEQQVDDYWNELIKDSTDLTDSKREFLTEQKAPVSSGKKKSNEQPKTQ